MLTLPAAVRIYACLRPVDFRRGFDGLATLVREGLGRDPLSGDVFVFRNRRGDRIKILFWDRDGFWLWYKRLERGTFRFPRSEQEACEIDPAELHCILAGLDLTGRGRQQRYVRLPKRCACVS
ncbi:MAG: transposase [Alphaproteobacteria bacterium]|nr:MAG: transposase [Alphaproteobacteria bacterium]